MNLRILLKPLACACRFVRRPLFLLFCAAVFLLALFYPRSYVPDPIFAPGAYYDVVVQGTVETCQRQDTRITLLLSKCQILYENELYSCPRLRVTLAGDRTDGAPPLQAGFLLSVFGSLTSFQPARNPGNFDANAYYQARHISYQVSARQITILDRQTDFLREWLLQARRVLSDRLALLVRMSGEADADSCLGILSALLLGDKDNLDEQNEALYQSAGILHILSVSGLHVSLLGGALLALTKRLYLPLWVQKFSACLLIVFYWQFCGASLSAGRAAIMFLCLCAAPLFERSYDSLSSLSLAGLLLLWDSPGLLFQPAFQLSFGAILGILLVCPSFCPIRTPGNKPPLFSALFFGFGLQLTLLPVTLYHFFRYPLYAVLLNLVVLPLTAPLFLCGAAGLLLSFLWLPFGAVLLFPCRLILLLYDRLCTAAAALPLASCLLGRPALWRIFLYYVLLALFCFLRRPARRNEAAPKTPSKKRRLFPPTLRKEMLSLALCLLLLPPVLLCPLPVPALTVTFLDVGQGDCALLRTPDGTTILIDGGSSDIQNAAANRLIPFLESQAVDFLDYVFLSHSDEDHVGAVADWLESGRLIGCLILPALPDRLAAEASYQELLSLAGFYQIPVLYFREGSRFTEGELSLLCLAPAAPESPQAAGYTSLNAASQVLLAEFRGIRLLFTGDCGEEGEEFLVQKLRQLNLSCHILKVGHHGSATSTGSELLAQLNPQLAVISCGIQNRYRHPHPDVLARLRAQEVLYYITADCGAVTVTVRGQTAQIHTMLPADN
ncbi:MAG: DNA internalization-related competence protein ComEC/Rec2 [Lachnospiraceae bacterium]|nr:DNA internalization-related competence protein ComEC/Rec2 [Lachnospiraceae bacterium]